MSHAMTFDTLAFVKKLEASGIEARQSEAITEAIADVYESNLTMVATKDDLSALEARLEAKLGANATETKKDIDALELKVDGRLSKLKGEIITWVVGLVFAQLAVFSMIVKLMLPG